MSKQAKQKPALPEMVRRVQPLAPEKLKDWNGRYLNKEVAGDESVFYWSGLLTYVQIYWALDDEGAPIEGKEPTYNPQEANNCIRAGHYANRARGVARVVKPIFPHEFGLVDIEKSTKARAKQKGAVLGFYGKRNVNDKEELKELRRTAFGQFRRNLAQEIAFQKKAEPEAWAWTKPVDAVPKAFAKHDEDVFVDGDYITGAALIRIANGFDEAGMMPESQVKLVKEWCEMQLTPRDKDASPPANTQPELDRKELERKTKMENHLTGGHGKPETATQTDETEDLLAVEFGDAA